MLHCSHIAYFSCFPFVTTLNWQKTTLPGSYSHTRLLHSICSTENKGAFSLPSLGTLCVWTHISALSMTRQLRLQKSVRKPQATTISLHPFLEHRVHMEAFPWDAKGKLAFGKGSLLHNFTTFKLVWSFWRRMSYLSGYWVGEDKDRNIASWRPSDVPFWWYKRKSSPIHLPEMSARTLLRVPALV